MLTPTATRAEGGDALLRELERVGQIVRATARRSFIIQMTGGVTALAIQIGAVVLVGYTRQPWWLLLCAVAFGVLQGSFEWCAYVLASGRQPMRELWAQIGWPYSKALADADLRHYHFWNDVAANIRDLFTAAATPTEPRR